MAAGVGTGITGRGAHILLLDDLVKDIEAADSATIKENTWEWYASTAYTRLAPGGGVLGLTTGELNRLFTDKLVVGDINTVNLTVSQFLRRLNSK